MDEELQQRPVTAGGILLNLGVGVITNFQLEKTFIGFATAPAFGFFSKYQMLGSWIRRLQADRQLRARAAGKTSLLYRFVEWVNRVTIDEQFRAEVLRRMGENLAKRGVDLTQLMISRGSDQFDIGIFRLSEGLRQYFQAAESYIRDRVVQKYGTSLLARTLPGQIGQVGWKTALLYNVGKYASQWALSSIYGTLLNVGILVGTQIYRGFKNLGVQYRYLQFQRRISSNARRLSTVNGPVTSEEQMYLAQQFAQLGGVTNEQQLLRENQYAQYYFMGVNP